MSDYNKTTDFATKDTLPTGNPDKLVKGTELDVEFNNVQTASATKLDSSSPTSTGTFTHNGDMTVTGEISGTIDGGTY